MPEVACVDIVPFSKNAEAKTEFSAVVRHFQLLRKKWSVQVAESLSFNADGSVSTIAALLDDTVDLGRVLTESVARDACLVLIGGADPPWCSLSFSFYLVDACLKYSVALCDLTWRDDKELCELALADLLELAHEVARRGDEEVEFVVVAGDELELESSAFASRASLIEHVSRRRLSYFQVLSRN